MKHNVYIIQWFSRYCAKATFRPLKTISNRQPPSPNDAVWNQKPLWLIHPRRNGVSQPFPVPPLFSLPIF